MFSLIRHFFIVIISLNNDYFFVLWRRLLVLVSDEKKIINLNKYESKKMYASSADGSGIWISTTSSGPVDADNCRKNKIIGKLNNIMSTVNYKNLG